MPIDARIALQDTAPQIEDPTQAAGRILTLKNLVQQGKQNDIELKGAQMKQDAAQRAIDGQKVYSDLLAANSTQAPDGSLTVNHGAIIKGLSQAGFSDLAKAHDAQRRADEKSQLDNQKTELGNAKEKISIGASALGSVVNAPEDQKQAAYGAARADLIAKGIMKPEEIPDTYDPRFVQEHFQGAIDADKQADNHQKDLDYKLKENEYQQRILENKPKSYKEWQGNAAQLLSAATNQQQWDSARDSLKAGGAPVGVLNQFPAEYSAAATAAAASAGMTPAERATEASKTATLTESTRHDKATEDQAKATLTETKRHNAMMTEGVTLTPGAKQKMAEMFATTGTLPPLGNGQAAGRMRSEIINLSAEKFPQVDFATNKAAFQANEASLKGLQKTQDAIEGFEKTAGKNLDRFLEQAKGAVDTGSPFLNTPLRQLNEKMFGDKDMTAYSTARQVAVTEIAKVLNNPTSGGALSDSARHEVQELIGKDATLKQVYSAATILKADMKSRRESGQEQIDAINKRIGTARGDAPASGVTNPGKGGTRPPLSSFEKK